MGKYKLVNNIVNDEVGRQCDVGVESLDFIKVYSFKKYNSIVEEWVVV